MFYGERNIFILSQMSLIPYNGMINNNKTFNQDKQMDISIVIPAFNESQKIGKDIESTVSFFRQNNLTGEVIVVDDGSRDDTADVAKKSSLASLQEISVEVIRYEENRGKGYAIRTGIKRSSGEYVMFMDSGGCVPLKYILDGMEMLKKSENKIDIAHASRKLDHSTIIEHQNMYRRLCSRLFQWFVIHCLKIKHKFTDTQCGFKLYRGDVARKLYGECVTDGFMFDIEIIRRAQKYGYGIKEFPIEWTCDSDSRLHPTKSMRGILTELLHIKRTLSKESDKE
jgi:dolichyl-phosphate beta-glucosyltransferase